MIDFSEPGVLGVFTDERTVAKLESSMQKTGFLPAENMAKTFNLMRGNDLIWSYVVNNWLMGEDPPAFDLLTWNADSTRMPADMHSFYLRSCYLREPAGPGRDGARRPAAGPVARSTRTCISWPPSRTTSRRGAAPTQAARLPAGDVRFVLSNSGHIAGIVNPPGPEVPALGGRQRTPADPDELAATAPPAAGSWWEDWASWAQERAGARVKPPAMGSNQHPPVGDAPGEYVLG